MGGTTIIHFVIQVVHNEKGVKTTLSKSNQPFLQLPSIAIPGPLKSPTIEQQGGSETVGFQHRQMIVKHTHTHTHTHKHTHTHRDSHTHMHTQRDQIQTLRTYSAGVHLQRNISVQILHIKWESVQILHIKWEPYCRLH